MQITVKYIDTSKYTITVDYDQDGYNESPLSWTTPDERGATFALYHKQYNLPMEIDAQICEHDNWTQMALMFTRKGGKLEGQVYKFVNWYEHSGVAVSLVDTEQSTDRFDAGIAGIVFGETYETIEMAFSDWKHYIEGEIYGVTIQDEQGNEIDCSAGFYEAESIRDFLNESINGYQEENLTIIGDAAYIM